MAWTNLKAAIAAVVRTNNNQEITGANLQSVLNAIVNNVGANATYAGIATPSTNPGTPDGPVFYFATQAGTYSNFGGAVIAKGLNILLYKNNSWDITHIDTVGNIDNEPTQNSNNLVKSGGVYSAIQTSTEVALAALNAIAEADDNPTEESNNLVKSGGVYEALQSAGNMDKLMYELGGSEEVPEILFQGSLPSTTRTVECYIEVDDELFISLDDTASYINIRTNKETIYYKQGGTVQTNNIINGKFTATKNATQLLISGYSQSSATIVQNIEKPNIVTRVEELEGLEDEIDDIVNSLGGSSQYEHILVDNAQGSTSEVTVAYNLKVGQQLKITFDGSSDYISLKTSSETIYRKVGGTVDTNNIDNNGIFTATAAATNIKYASYSELRFTIAAIETRLGITNDVEAVTEDVGDIDELETENKTDLVNAINEVNRNLPEMESVTEYAVMRGGGGGTTELTYPWDIKRGDKFTIFRDDTGDVSYCVVRSYLNGNQVQEFVRYVGGNPQGSGRLGVEIEATGNADSFGISSYGKYSITTTVKKMNVEVEVEKRLINRLYGKRWLLIGDSISTEGSSWAVKGYGHYIAQSLGMYYKNIAVGGKTMQWGCQQVPSQDDDYDLITVMLGTNNEGYNMGIGNINDAPDASSTAYIPATKAMIELLRAKYPKSVIIFITPIRRCNVDAQGNVDNHNAALKGYVDALIEVCNLYCIPVVDLWNIIAPEIDSIRSLFFCGTHEAGSDQDGTHPNELGHQMFLAPVIEDAIIKYSQYYFNTWN